MATKSDKAIKISQKHLLGIQDLSINDVNLILDEALEFIKVNQSKNKKIDALRVIEILRKLNRLKVKGINIVKKHEKTTKEKKGGIISKENFFDISNVKSLDIKDEKKIKKVKK